jgi:predicted nucleotidyltransferase
MTAAPAVGIVAEYNPFHKGHAHQLEEIRKQLGPVPVIAVMSGPVTQRGEAALWDKWSRTALALSGGVDLILELPAAFACRSAEAFARGGVETLAVTGLVTHLSFGCETEDYGLLKQLAAERISPEEWQEALAQGRSYAQAARTILEQRQPAYRRLLTGSNNQLALEYLRALDKEYPSLRVLPVRRDGTAYNADSLQGPFPSASALRRELREHGFSESFLSGFPAAVQPVLHRLAAGFAPVREDVLDDLLLYRLELSSAGRIASLADVSEGLENLICKNKRAGSFRAIVAAAATKRYSPSRLQRLLWQILLSDSEVSFAEAKHLKPAYLRVLGFTEKGRALLSRMKQTAAVPILPCLEKDTLSHLPAEGRRLLKLDVRATDLYELITTGKITDLDYKKAPVKG